MNFCNKLDFLMKLTQVSNKELAAEISVDRSLISLLRTGRRGKPHNKLHIRNMAESFSKRITANYQRQALAETSGITSIGAELSAEILALHLEQWLQDDIDTPEPIHSGKNHESADKDGGAPSASAPEGSTLFFYGDEGKRKAMRYVMNILKDGMLGIFDSSDLEWAISDPSFVSEIKALIERRAYKGNTFTQILPPMPNLSAYTDSLQFMLPIYTKMNTSVYCLPRIADMPYAFTLAVAPGQCVLLSYGLRSGRTEKITMVSTDKSLVNAHAEQFREYISQCRSALLTHRDPKKFPAVISEFLSLQGDCCRISSSLSILTMTVDLFEKCAKQYEKIMGKEAFRRISSKITVFEQSLSDHAHLDIAPLHSVEEIRSGKVPIACPCIPCKDAPRYTTETYALHLENILRLMDTYENYSFIPIAPESYPDYDLTVNEGSMALLARREAQTPMLLEFRRPEIVMAFKEHLIRIADKEIGAQSSRETVKAKLNALILALRNAAQD